MAHVRKPKYTRTVPADATRTTIKGKPCATWTGRDGEKIVGVLIGNGSRCRVESSVYHIFYTDHRKKPAREAGFASRRLTEKRMHEIVDRVEMMRAGSLPESASPKKAVAISDLLDRWRDSLVDAGHSEHHAKQARYRAGATLQQSSVVVPVDITRDGVGSALTYFRRHGVPRNEDNRQKPKPLSPQSHRHFLAACKTFAGWLVDNDYLDADPLARAKGPAVEGFETFTRRSLTAAELERLMAAATARKSRCPLSGPDRATVYLVAFYTGFRLNEIGELTPEMFKLDSASPAVVLPARFTKNKKDARQYVPPHVVDRLKAAIAGKPNGEPLWGWATNFFRGKKAAEVLRNDLAAAKIPESTVEGRIDFHALRVSYITALSESGTALQVVQRAARHSDPRLTMKHYLRVKDAELADAANRLKPPT